MIFYRNTCLAYGPSPDPQEVQKFARMVLILGAQYRGEL